MQNSKKVPPTKRPPGRPAGSGLQTVLRNRMIAQAKIKPLEVLLEVMAEKYEKSKTAKTPAARAKAQHEAVAVAEKAAPYLHAKLQATTVKGDDKNPLGFTLTLPGADILRAAIRGKTDPDKG